jgi:hypothetical protein
MLRTIVDMLSVAIKCMMLGAIRLNVVMLIVVVPLCHSVTLSICQLVTLAGQSHLFSQREKELKQLWEVR